MPAPSFGAAACLRGAFVVLLVAWCASIAFGSVAALQPRRFAFRRLEKGWAAAASTQHQAHATTPRHATAAGVLDAHITTPGGVGAVYDHATVAGAASSARSLVEHHVQVHSSAHARMRDPSDPQVDLSLSPVTAHLSPSDPCFEWADEWVTLMVNMTARNRPKHDTEPKFRTFCANFARHQERVLNKPRLWRFKENSEEIEEVAPVIFQLNNWTAIDGQLMRSIYLSTAQTPGTNAACAQLEDSRGTFTEVVGVAPANELNAYREANALPEAGELDFMPDFDWSEQLNIGGPVLEQGSCGSCWAFASAEVIRMGFVIQCSPPPHLIVSPPLSIQQITQCAAKPGQDGCRGGQTTLAFEYATKHPIRTAKAFPAPPLPEFDDPEWKAGPCPFPAGSDQTPNAKPAIKGFDRPIAPCTDDSYCMRQNELELARFVRTMPVTAAIDIQWIGPMYDGWIVRASDCSPLRCRTAHSVVIVGLLTDAKTGMRVWKVKNSYGAKWGHDGYLYLEYGTNTCGIANLNEYAISACVTPATTPIASGE